MGSYTRAVGTGLNKPLPSVNTGGDAASFFGGFGERLLNIAGNFGEAYAQNLTKGAMRPSYDNGPYPSNDQYDPSRSSFVQQDAFASMTSNPVVLIGAGLAAVALVLLLRK